MEKSCTQNPITLRKITDVSKYLPQIDPTETDAEIYNDVSQNRDIFHAILADDRTVGLACIRQEDDVFLYIYIFPTYRRRGYGYLSALAAQQQLPCSAPLNLATAYDSRNESAAKFVTKCGFVDKFSTSILRYRGTAFDIPDLPIRTHRDEDFYEAYTLSAEAFHFMRLETGHDPNSVPYEADEAARKVCLDTANERYVYVLDGEIVGAAHIDGAEIDNIAIKITHQGKGLGKLFVQFLVNEILEKGGEPFLYCLSVNTKARRLYDLLGFEESARNTYAVKRIP